MVIILPVNNWSKDITGAIATGYGLDDRGIGVQVPVRARNFSPCPDWPPGSHPVSYPVGTGSLSPGAK
jgi:hypothetical protein